MLLNNFLICLNLVYFIVSDLAVSTEAFLEEDSQDDIRLADAQSYIEEQEKKIDEKNIRCP